MCVPILRSIGTKLRNLENISTYSGSKVMAQTVVLMFLMTLTFDLCPVDCHIK